MQVIVNADDYGRDESTSKAILECFRRGWITSTTLMVNMPYADQATLMARKYHIDDKVGLHINLAEGIPITQNIRGIPLFCTEGIFNQRIMHSLGGRIMLTGRNRAALREELEAQIEKYMQYGYRLKHADSHYHIHNLLPVLFVVLPLLRHYGFRSLRIARNINAENKLPNRIFKAAANTVIRLYGMNCTRYFSSFRDLALCVQSGKRYQGVIELMTHPVFVEGKINNVGSMPFEDFFAAVQGLVLISQNKCQG